MPAAEDLSELATCGGGQPGFWDLKCQALSYAIQCKLVQLDRLVILSTCVCVVCTLQGILQPKGKLMLSYILGLIGVRQVTCRREGFRLVLLFGSTVCLCVARLLYGFLSAIDTLH